MHSACQSPSARAALYEFNVQVVRLLGFACPGEQPTRRWELSLW
jgi:hypothetical protein